MDQFAEQLSRLAELSDDEISELETSLVAAFDAADESGDIDTMSELAAAIDEVRVELENRTGGEAAEAAPVEEDLGADLAVAASAAVAEAEAPAAEADAVPQPEAEAAPAVEAETETEEAPVEEAAAEEVETEAPDEATAESADESTDEATPAESTSEATDTDLAAEPQQEETMAELDATDVVEEHKPENVQPATVIRAGGDIPGITAGAELADMDAVVEAMTSKVNGMRNLTGGNGEQLTVASMQASAAEARPDLTLLPGDPDGNAKKIRAVMADPAAITAAANGWCAPRTPRYEVYGVGTTDRPVRDSLPGFNADRGGILYMEPPVLGGLSDPDGVGIWQFVDDAWEAEEVAGGTTHGSTKIILEVECGDEQTADTYAITTQLRFTNMMARAYPEWVRRNTELTMVAQARTAETVLLTKMFGTATDVPVDPTPSLGAARDALVVLRGLAASYRNRHRMGLNETLDVWAPAWWLDAMALDLQLQAPGDQIKDARAEANGYLNDAGLDVTWFLDEVIGDDQLFTEKATFPAFASVLVASKGSFLYLDGGTLDLGVVRDSTLVGTNKYIEFAETFEGVANIGIEAEKVSMPVGLIGGTAAGIDTSDGIVVEAS